MKTDFVFDKVAVSWTKYDIVRVADLVESKATMLAYYRGDVGMDPSVLRSALLVKDLQDPLPAFWEKLWTFDLRIRRGFVFFLFLFSSNRAAKSFAENCYDRPFCGAFNMSQNELIYGKELTNARSLLVECGLASTLYRRKIIVPFDGSFLLNEYEIGPVFRSALEYYIRRNSSFYDPSEFYAICSENSFHKALGMEEAVFKTWLEGNSPNPYYVNSLSFKQFFCFDQPCNMVFGDSKEIYFVGENGDGKTLLLMALYSALKGYRILKDKDPKYVGPFKQIVDGGAASDLVASDNMGQEYRLDSAPMFEKVFAYGVHRGRYSAESDASSFERFGFMTLFSTEMTLRDPIDWLQKTSLEHPNHPELSFEQLKVVLSEILEKKVEIIREEGKILFLEKGAKLSFSELSEGYRSIIIFVCDLMIRLSKNCRDQESVFQQHGVVIVDEICLHLHPKWQKTIVRKLRQLFPNIQFFMTTHSPIVLLGAGEDAIFYRVVREHGHSYVSEPYYQKDWRDMMLNTISTSSLFDLDSASMANSPDDVDTSDTYLMSRISKRVQDRLLQEKRLGHTYYSKQFIDTLIDTLLIDVKYDKD